MTFTPASRAYTNLPANQTAQNFSAASAPTYSLVASPSAVVAGGGVTVNWTAPVARPTSDWVALYGVGQTPNYSYLDYKYIGGGTSGH